MMIDVCFAVQFLQMIGNVFLPPLTNLSIGKSCILIGHLWQDFIE
jgi:hypothetical protein